MNIKRKLRENKKVIIVVLLLLATVGSYVVMSTGGETRPSCDGVTYSSQEDALEVSTVDQLYCIGRTPNASLYDSYVLTQDIDASETRNWVVEEQTRTIYSAGAGDTFKLSFEPVESTIEVTKNNETVEHSYDSEFGLEVQQRGELTVTYETANNPIGGFSPIRGQFVGEFDGQNHSISNLYINETNTNFVGLFTAVGDRSNTPVVRDSLLQNEIPVSYNDVEGTVHGLKLEDATIRGRFDTGSVAGRNRGAIYNVDTSGSVTATETGGIVGSNFGFVVESKSDVDVVGEQNTGGVAGSNKGMISDTDTHGTVDVESFNAGGITGINDGLIQKSWTDSSVSAGTDAGGLVGNNQNGLIDESYSAGTVEGQNVGGLVGNNGATIRNSYTENGRLVYTNRGEILTSYSPDEVTNSSTGRIENSYSLESFTQDEVQGSNAATTIEGFDFNNVWNTVVGDSPILRDINKTAQTNQ